MATLLQLVNDTERESGTVSSTSRLASVAGASGRQEKIVRHVIEAWRLIQNERTDWPWMRKTADVALTVGQSTYLSATFAPPITDLARFEKHGDYRKRSPVSIYDGAIGRVDENELRRCDWDEWARQFDFGQHQANRPHSYAIRPDRALCVGPKPDKAYRIRLAYWRKPQMLSADGDVPICAEEHHQIIVWRALMLLAGHDEAGFSLADAQAKYSACFRAMVNDRDDMLEP